jgi:predicted DNA binding CopG/RHH family protein|tara:strand:- start:256 stop:615 length:360 start_codon:yes stop_codon:yes gene_type:complete
MATRKPVEKMARIHERDNIGQFIDVRVQELAIKSITSKVPSSMTSVTVRLPKGEVQAIDKLASVLDVSRQELLFEIIGTGMDQAIKSFANVLTGEERTKWVEDMINTWTAFDEELEGEE